MALRRAQIWSAMKISHCGGDAVFFGHCLWPNKNEKKTQHWENGLVTWFLFSHGNTHAHQAAEDIYTPKVNLYLLSSRRVKKRGGRASKCQV